MYKNNIFFFCLGESEPVSARRKIAIGVVAIIAFLLMTACGYACKRFKENGKWPSLREVIRTNQFKQNGKQYSYW